MANRLGPAENRTPDLLRVKEASYHSTTGPGLDKLFKLTEYIYIDIGVFIVTKFYTGVGDSGKTAIGGRKLSKGELIFEAVGDIDELNSVIGVAMSKVGNDTVKEALSAVQNRLFGIGAEIAATIDPMFKPKRAVSVDDTKALENYIAKLSSGLDEIREFVLPGGANGAEFLDLGRAVARRAERSAVRLGAVTSLDAGIITYLNRLSSLLFVAARRVNMDSGFEEKHPDYS